MPLDTSIEETDELAKLGSIDAVFVTILDDGIGSTV